MRILVAEDDIQVLTAVTTALRREGYEVDGTGDGEEALYLATKEIYDLVILDIVMPSLSGLDVLHAIRERDFAVPAIFTTARDSIRDRVVGLGSGADDYLVKPYALSELVARVQALLRRTSGVQQNAHILRYGCLELNTRSHELDINGTAVHLTQKEFELFEYLLINNGRILTRDQIIERLWDCDTDLGYDILDVHMHNLRKKLRKAMPDAELIATVRGVGYLLKVESDAQ
ncbi:hypothetical protein JI75_06505 [Berryella intestinalis]|uniref:DNA-binding response regulator n=1 Tax=Berryella intestinalis TaxID=1531429 RepID=A0A0A8B4L9_9ACTN|nr:response regulator transcription factor [Berryella intestinalis]AJC12355.1 hypothetical protein JI75_06505 [Berryella intestinalis]